MSSRILMYEAKVFSGSDISMMCIAGTCFGIIGDKVLDGEQHLSSFVKTAWIDDQGIGFLTANGDEYLILELDAREPVNRNRQRTSDLFALAFLGS
jgi:hypothetical protein